MNNPKISFRKFYYTFILCLIPLLGILAGLIIIIFGIIKYKRWKIILLGVSACIISIFSSYLLINYLMNTNESKNAFAMLSQKALNSFVSDIEFYKLQHGDYPDSLIQLHDNNKISPIIEDPILIWANPKASTGFNYQKISSKYKLYSSGVDGIANTKDDISPNIDIDSSHIGLIK